MLKQPDQYRSNDRFSTDFQSEDISVWTKFFDRSQILDENDRTRLTEIFYKLVINILKYEREQDFQLLEGFSKRLLSNDDNEQLIRLTIVDQQQDRLKKLDNLCQRVKRYQSIEKLLSMILQKSNDLTLPPINRNRSASSICNDDTQIHLPKNKKQKTKSRQQSNPVLMHGPVTLQNIYHALPAATLQFAQDEYVWHRNRPVNVIVSTGVQLPNVLTESIRNSNSESEQFFSKLIEEIIEDYQKRHPADHYAALRQMKHKSDEDLTDSPRKMNAFETLIDLVQRKHLGKLRRYFLNVVSTNRHFNPYDLITVPHYQADPENHYVFSVFGILNVRQNGADVEFFELAEWYRHAKLWHACRQIPFFREFLVKKQFSLWLANARFSRFLRHRSEIEQKHLLFMDNRVFQMAFIEIRRVILEYQQLPLLPKLFPGMILSLNEFDLMIQRHAKDTIEYTKKFFHHIKTIVEMTRDTLTKKYHLILKCLQQDQMTFNQTAGSMYEQRMRKENLRKELDQMQIDLSNLCPFINLCSSMICSCLCDIQREQLSLFHLTNVTFLTKLHLNDYDSIRMLNYLPSWDDYQELFSTILQQPQTILCQQWKSILQFELSLQQIDQIGSNIRQEGLTNQCDKCGNDLYTVLQETSANKSCQCQKQTPKEDLAVKGRGFFNTSGKNQLIEFETIFIKDLIYENEMKNVINRLRLSFDELDIYCESNEWLCEINRFCLQWTPNQMKQMSEGKQVFLIEVCRTEQLNLLRGWMDKTRTFELKYSTANSQFVFQMDCSVISQDLCLKIETIYQDFGKYLYRYACSNAQMLIEKFQTALQIFEQRPSAIEEFAKYASYLIPHKLELSANQQTIEYFSSLFEIIFMHFGHLRQDDEQIEKVLTDTWKLFQKTLSDAADFVAQQTLIIKERLRDTFEKYLNEAELLYNHSTSGVFLDPTQDPMEIVKLLKTNCLDFLRIEKQLRQYAQWRTLLAANSLNSTDEDHVHNEDLENITLWSNNIDLRKDLWKYLEITTSSIKEWRNTLINKFNIRRAQEKIECWLKIAEDFKEKIGDDDPIVLYWIDILEEFEQNIELLKKLLSDAMTIDQWKLLFRANGHDYDPNMNYRIQDLIDFNILQIENQDIFNQIHKQATREQKLKEKLIHMQTWLSDLHYRVVKYKPSIKITSIRNQLNSSYRQRLSRYRELRARTPTTQDAIVATEVTNENTDESYIMINSQEILRLIEDRLLLLHTNEPFSNEINTRREQFQQYYNLFDNVKEMTQLWFETQTKWIFLRSAFANFNLNTQASNYFQQIFIKFNEVDENFRNFQKLAFQNPSVAGLAKVEMNRVYFRHWLQTFNELINEIDSYLTDQYRSKFSRFYFLSNEELVHLISMGLDPRLYLPYVRQLFQSVEQIQFHLPELNFPTTNNQTINSATIDVYAYRLEGMSIKNHLNEEINLISKLKLLLPKVDTVGLNTHLISPESLTKWFQSLDYLLKYSLAKLTFEYFDKKIDEQFGRNNSTSTFPLQIILLVQHILFIVKLQKQIQSKANLTIQNFKYKIEDEINFQIQNLNKKQDCLLVQQFYFRDILSKLTAKDEYLNLNSYEWLSIIKYEVNSDKSTDQKIDLVQFANRIHYNFELIDPPSTFIISPMMERTIFELTQSICNYRLGLLHGPSQFGRSTIVQTLAQLCGTNCLTVLCNSSLTTDRIENIHQGLLVSNSWALFKDIQQLSNQCLSMLSVCIRQIRVRLEEKSDVKINLKRPKSESNLNLISNEKLRRNQSNEYPLTGGHSSKNFQRKLILNGQINSFPLTYGIFATFDQFYQPISPSIQFECRTISMSCPDLKLITESLLYKARLFTIKEREDCRETAENLVQLIEYLRLTFDQLKIICSPFILIPRIIEQSKHSTITKSISLVFQRYQLDHVYLQQIIEQFFPSDSSADNENDDELRYVESILHEAYEDKLAFDDEEIYNNTSRLMHSIKRNDLIFVTGPVGTGKSSLIRLAERTINKQMSTVNVDEAEEDEEEQKLVIVRKVYPNSFDEDQFYKNTNSFLEEWKRSYSTTISTEIANDQYWLIFDIDSHSNWLTADKIEFIYNDILSLLSRQNGSIKILIECDELPHKIPSKSSIFPKTFVLNLNKFSSQRKLIEKAVRNLELKLHLLDLTLSPIKDFVIEIIEPYVNYLEQEHICESYVTNYTDSFIKIFSSYIEQHLIDVQQHHHGLHYMFAYAFIWAFVHPIHIKFESQIDKFVRNLLKSYEFPVQDCKLTDLYPDMTSYSHPCFVNIHHWLKSRKIVYDCIPEYVGSFRLMTMLISSNYPLGIFSYEQGFGKTTLIKQLLSNCSYFRYVSNGSNVNSIRKEIFDDNSQIISHRKPNDERKFIVWMEDLQSNDVELIRHWFEKKENDFNYVVTGKRPLWDYSLRLTRHFVPIVFNEKCSTLIDSIYSIQIKNWLEEFPVDAIHHPIELAHACSLTLEEIFQFLKENLNSFHWNLHHVEQIVNGLFLLDPKYRKGHFNLQNQLFRKKQQEEQVTNVVRLLANEISRVVYDRFVENNDKNLFREFFFKTIRTNFCTELEYQIVATDEQTSLTANELVTNGKKQVKFKLGLVSDRASIGAFEGPIVHFGKLIGLPKLRDPSKLTNQDEIIDKLTSMNYFSKEILRIHGEIIGERSFYTNQYQQSNHQLIQSALESCQKKFEKTIDFQLEFVPRTCRHILNLIRIFSLPQNGHALLRTRRHGQGRQNFAQLASMICRQQFFNAHQYIPLKNEDESVRQCLRSTCLLAGLKQKNVVVLLRENLLSDRFIEQLYIFTREATFPGLYSNDELIRIAAALSPGLPSNRRVMKTNSVLKTFYARIRKRLHLVILDNNPNIRHKGLFSSCFVDEYGSWTKQELSQISRFWLRNPTVQQTSFVQMKIESICDCLAEIYLLFDDFQYFTLKNLRRTIDYFAKCVENIQQTEQIHLQRCESMLNRSTKSERIIEMNEKLQEQLQNEIDHLQEKLNQLNQHFQTKKNHFSIAVDDCREEEKLINEMSIALDQLRQDVQSDVEKANPQYENALRALKLLNKSDYDEIRTFRQPPQPVLAVMNTICIMFKKKPEWSEAKILMVKENFFDDLIYYDKNNISDEIFEMLTKIVEFDTFRPSFVATSSKAAAGLCAWILAVYQYAKIARSQKTKLEQVKAYQELFNKRQQILGEKRLRAEKFKEELAELINERRTLTNDLQAKIKRQNHFQSTIQKTNAMLNLIQSDILFWNQQIQTARHNQQTAVAHSLLTATYFTFLVQFNVDQRQDFIQQLQTNQIPIENNDFQPLDFIFSQKEINDYLLKCETTSAAADSNLLLNSVILTKQIEKTFVLFVQNPEDETIFWKDLLANVKSIDEQNANHEIDLYIQYKENQRNLPSTNSTTASAQDRSQLYSRISSSKTYVTEVTEKSSLWESSTAISKPTTSLLLSKSAVTVTLSDIEQSQSDFVLPEFNLDEFQRPQNNLIRLSAKQNQNLNEILLKAMFFGVILIIDECDFLELNSFFYRFLHWSLTREDNFDRFPNLFRFGTADIFVNSSFRLILNFRRIDRLEWSNLLLKNRLIDLSLSSSKISNDLWINLVEFKCQPNFVAQLRTNQRNALISSNDEIQRRDDLINLLETKENLTIDSEDLFQLLTKSNDERILIENSLNEHRLQREILCERTGANFYRETAKNLTKFYVLTRDSNVNLNLSLDLFKRILFSNLTRKISSTNLSNFSNENVDLTHRVQSRESYLRCFQSIYSYLNLALDKHRFQLVFLLFSFVEQNQIENVHLLKSIFVDSNRSLCQKKFPNLDQHLIDFECQWKEYLSSTNQFDFINKTPFEQTNSLNIFERFLLSIVLQPKQIGELIERFLTFQYEGFFQEKSFEPIEQIYQLNIQTTNQLFLIWNSSSGFVDPIDEIVHLANKSNESVRIVSAVDRKRLEGLIEKKRQSWLIITDIHLFDDQLLFIRDFLLSQIEKKIWLIADLQFENRIPHWLTQRAFQIHLNNFNKTSLSLRLKQKYPQIQPSIDLHTTILTKNLFTNNLIEKDLKDSRTGHLLFAYQNLISNRNEQTLIEFIRNLSDPFEFIQQFPNLSKINHDEFLNLFQKLFSNIFLLVRNEQENVFNQSTIATEFQSNSLPELESPSLIDIFLSIEFGQNRNSNVNLKFLKRIQQFIEVLRIEQMRKADDELVFHLKPNENTNELKIEGFHDPLNSNEKHLIITLEENSSDQPIVLSSIEIDHQTRSYLPIVNQRKDDEKSQLIRLLIDR